MAICDRMRAVGCENMGRDDADGSPKKTVQYGGGVVLSKPALGNAAKNRKDCHRVGRRESAEPEVGTAGLGMGV